VKLGEHNLDTNIDCERGQCADAPQIIDAKSVIIPSEYDDSKLKHDVAIVELVHPANITHFVSPICLPQTTEMKQDSLMGDMVEVAVTIASRVRGH
jgi:Trypsin